MDRYNFCSLFRVRERKSSASWLPEVEAKKREIEVGAVHQAGRAAEERQMLRLFIYDIMKVDIPLSICFLSVCWIIRAHTHTHTVQQSPNQQPLVMMTPARMAFERAITGRRSGEGGLTVALSCDTILPPLSLSLSLAFIYIVYTYKASNNGRSHIHTHADVAFNFIIVRLSLNPPSIIFSIQVIILYLFHNSCIYRSKIDELCTTWKEIEKRGRERKPHTFSSVKH